MTVQTTATILNSRGSSAGRVATRRWTLADVAIFVSPLLTIGTAGTPLEILCWIMIPGLLIVGRPILTARRLPAFTAPDLLLFLMMTAAVVSYLVSEYRDTAQIPTAYFVAYYALVVVSCMAINSYRQLGIFLSGASLAFVVLLARSLLLPGTAQADAGLTGVLGQENATGSMAATAIVVMLTLQRLFQLGYATAFNTKLFRAALIVGPLLAGVVLLLSASRGASLACAIFLVLWIIPAARHISLAHRLLIGIGAIIFALLSWSRITELFVFRRFLYLAYELNLVAMPPPGRYYDAMDVRGLLIDRAVTVFMDHKLFGAGLGTFREFSEFVYTHTTFYEFLYSLGLVGTVPAMLVLVCVLWRFGARFLGGSRHRALCWAMLALLAYFMFQGMTLPLVTSRIHMVLLITAFACARLVKLRPNGSPGDVLPPPRVVARHGA